MGPAVAQLPIKSHTCRVSVLAFASSAPEATLVESEKLASAESFKPDPLSNAVQARLTSVPCQAESGSAH